MQNENDNQRFVSPNQNVDDNNFEEGLRPQNLDEFIGQDRIKQNLQIFMQAAKNRKEPLEHVLLYGPPGLGKTTLSHIIANEMQAQIKVTSGPAIEKSGDLAAILTNLTEGDILFIDEIHRLNKVVEEILYPAMEDFALDIVIGKGPSARTLRLDLPKFTIIGATTKLSKLSSPLRHRFGNIYRLDFYSDDNINQIINRAARILNVEFEDSCSADIATRARKTPRIANRLLKRVRDFAQVKNDGKINLQIANEALELLEVDQLGLDEIDRKILRFIIERYNGGPVGLGTIAAAIAEETQTVEDVYEPFLMQLGFINRTPRGRMVTRQAYDHLQIKPNQDQESLL